MNATIASITFRGMLGRRRAILLCCVPAILLALSIGFAAAGSDDLDTTTTVLQKIALGTLLPLLSLIVGTGVIGPEIDDGQIMYILTKPIARPVVSSTKLAVAITLVTVFGAVPTLVAGLILTGTTAQLAVAFTVGMLVGGIAYCAIFVALAVVSRFAVAIGLMYALVWESLVGNFAPGAKALSVQQWAYAVTDALTNAAPVHASVSLGVAVPLLIIVTLGGTLIAGWRLSALSVVSAE
jgi:ABC-2 type transport system permease protein